HARRPEGRRAGISAHSLTMRRVIAIWLAVGWTGFAVLPWSAIGGRGFFAFQWLADYPLGLASAPALLQLFWHGRLWLLPLLAVLLLPLLLAFGAASDPAARARAARVLVATGVAGLAWIATIALSLDINGWTWPTLARVLGTLS